MSHSEDSHAGAIRSVTGPDARFHSIRKLIHSIGAHEIFGRSAQLAYYFFFSIFPGMIFVSAMLAVFSGPGSPLHKSLMQHLPKVLPPKAFHLVQHTLQQTGGHGGEITFGVIVALWSASAGMAAVSRTLNAVHEVDESRPFWKVRLTALLLTIACSILLLIAIAVLFWGYGMLRFSIGPGSSLIGTLIKVAQWGVAIVVVFVIFALVYFFAADVKDRKWHWVTSGAVYGVLLWILATIGLRFYLRYFHSFSATYGSLGAVIVLLLWFYIGGFALLVGEEINTLKETKAAKKGNPEAVPRGEKSSEAA